MKKTEKLGLNILEGSDPISVEGFNENAQLLDSLCGSMAMLETGTYTGNGIASRLLTFSRKPALVLITCGNYTVLCFHGFETAVVLTDEFSWCNKQITIRWDDSTNTLDLGTSTTYVNAERTQYHFVAFLTA